MPRTFRPEQRHVTVTACKLASHVFVCLADDRLVFSDIRQDRYQCLDRRNTRAVLHRFPNLARTDPASDAENPDSDRDLCGHILRALAQAGLLADDAAYGKNPAPPRIVAPAGEFNMRDDSAMPGLCHWLAFARAALVASASFRFQSLQQIVGRVDARKRRQVNTCTHDRSRLLDLVTVFHRLRPYYVRNYLCRFDSLALIEFLAHYGCFPDWVFGVTAEPFTAHCWVQDGDCVLNDSADFVGRFTPIMAF